MRVNCLLTYVVLTWVIACVRSELLCSRGEKYHTSKEGEDVCIVCDEGTYMPVDDHTLRRCINCTRVVDPDIETLVSPCNRFSNSVILCNDGYYRYTAQAYEERDVCKLCTGCEYPERTCQSHTDVVCCDLSQGTNTTRPAAEVCRDRSIVCGPGQFFRTSSEECLPCPAGTFMSAHNHTYKECLTCEELSENNLNQAVIIRPCSRTAPTLFGCKAGYFRDPTQESLQIEVPCTPCRICDRNLTDCGMFHDAVCDDEDRRVTTVSTNFTELSGAGGVTAMISQLKATFNGSMNSCILDCLQATIAQSVESSTRECLSNCSIEINEANDVYAWLSFGFHFVLLVIINCAIWLIPNYLDADSLGKLHLHVIRCTYVVFVANVGGIILFIPETLLKIRVIEDRGYGLAITTAICYIVLALNLALLVMLIFVNNVRLKHLDRRNVGKAQKESVPLCTVVTEIPDETREIRQQARIRRLQQESSSCDTSG